MLGGNNHQEEDEEFFRITTSIFMFIGTHEAAGGLRVTERRLAMAVLSSAAMGFTFIFVESVVSNPPMP